MSAGSSKYHIEPGFVLKLDRSRTVKKTGGLEYDVYLWIQKKGCLLKGRQEKDRYYWILTCLVPRILALHDDVVLQRRRVQKDSISLQLKSGYSVIADDVIFWYRDKDYEEFYKRLGLL